MDDLAMAKPKEIGPDAAALGKRLAYARDALGLSQEDLGKLIGVKSNQVSRYERGSAEVSMRALQTIADLAKIDYAWLTTGKGQPRTVAASGRSAAGQTLYPSLAGFLERHRQQYPVRDDEVAHLQSIRLPPQLAEVADDEWWIGQVVRFRNLHSRRNAAVHLASAPTAQPSPKRPVKPTSRA